MMTTTTKAPAPAGKAQTCLETKFSKMFFFFHYYAQEKKFVKRSLDFLQVPRERS